MSKQPSRRSESHAIEEVIKLSLQDHNNEQAAAEIEPKSENKENMPTVMKKSSLQLRYESRMLKEKIADQEEVAKASESAKALEDPANESTNKEEACTSSMVELYSNSEADATIPEETKEVEISVANKRFVKPAVHPLKLSAKICYPIRKLDTPVQCQVKEATKITSWSIGGAKNLMDKSGVDFFLRENSEILCLQDLQFSSEDELMKFLKLDGYQAHFNLNRGSSGIAVLTKVEPKAVKFTTGFSELDSEKSVMLMDFEQFRLLCVSAPSAGFGLQRLEEKSAWFDALKVFIMNLKNLRKKPLIIAGNFSTSMKEIGELDCAMNKTILTSSTSRHRLLKVQTKLRRIHLRGDREDAGADVAGIRRRIPPVPSDRRGKFHALQQPPKARPRHGERKSHRLLPRLEGPAALGQGQRHPLGSHQLAALPNNLAVQCRRQLKAK